MKNQQTSAYNQNPKTGKNRPENLPHDLLDIIGVWPSLPEHIKKAIKALIDSVKR